MSKEIAPSWGNDTTRPLRLASYEAITSDDLQGMLRRNHRSYAYDGQLVGHVFLPDPGLALGTSYVPMAPARSSVSVATPPHQTLMLIERPHTGARTLTLHTFGREYDVRVTLQRNDTLANTTATATYASATPGWATLDVTVPNAPCRVLVEYRRTSGGASGVVWISALRERVLDEVQL